MEREEMKILIAVWLATSFFYLDIVEVVNGFYSGCSGIVEAAYWNNDYSVNLKECRGEKVDILVTINGKQLRRIE
jgi:hypothetical protein